MKRIGEELEGRCLKFASEAHAFIKGVPRTTASIEVSKQLARSAASIGANYIEANESFSKKDFILRVRIAKKEARETCYWLRLLEVTGGHDIERNRLLGECIELANILGAILRNTLKA